MRGKPECVGVRVLSGGHHCPGARADWRGSEVLEEGGLAIRVHRQPMRAPSSPSQSIGSQSAVPELALPLAH